MKEVVPYQEERNWEAIVVGIAEVTMVVSYQKEWDLKAESA